MANMFKPGDVLRYEHKNPRYTFVGIVGNNTPRREGRLPLDAWKWTSQPERRWVYNPKNGGTARSPKDYTVTLVTGDEADRIHADFAAAMLTGDIENV